MKRIQRDKRLATPPLPCEYFDLIGGTSTGGYVVRLSLAVFRLNISRLIAIMLGRLRMSVEGAITAYGMLGEQVFSKRKQSMTQEGKFRATELKKAIMGIVATNTTTPSAPGGNADERMLDPRGEFACKVYVDYPLKYDQILSHLPYSFVCAVSSANMASPTRFRTYPIYVNETYNCFIWEAARATSAAPTFFKPIAIGIPPLDESFVDGGLRCNNPITQVLAEAHDLWPGRKVACVVSIGTGQVNRISIPPSTFLTRNIPLDVVNALANIATDCEQVAADCEHRFPDSEGVYTRFSVEQGMQDVALEEWKKMRVTKTHTDNYLREPHMVRKIDAVVNRLQSREGKATTAAMCM